MRSISGIVTVPIRPSLNRFASMEEANLAQELLALLNTIEPSNITGAYNHLLRSRLLRIRVEVFEDGRIEVGRDRALDAEVPDGR